MSTIRDVLQRKGATVLTTHRRASVLEAIGEMSQANIGALVIEENDLPVGIFTERDYLRKIALEGRSSRETVVEDVLVADPSVRKAGELRRLPGRDSGDGFWAAVLTSG